MARVGNGMMVRRFRRGAVQSTRGMKNLLLETSGAKSGMSRPVVVGYLPEGEGAWLIVASVAGSSRQPDWLYNLSAHPDATIQFPDGQRVEITAASVEGADAEAAWERIRHEVPAYYAYRSNTDREIPIIRLTRR
jgi:deazaflavin-dependent oxidoreductase (nitroreductase family)